MQIYYSEGPPTVTMGAAGVFVKDEPREIDNELAERILAKKNIVFKKAKKATGAPAAPQEEVTLG